jgi:hypothetical protein
LLINTSQVIPQVSPIITYLCPVNIHTMNTDFNIQDKKILEQLVQREVSALNKQLLEESPKYVALLQLSDVLSKLKIATVEVAEIKHEVIHRQFGQLSVKDIPALETFDSEWTVHEKSRFILLRKGEPMESAKIADGILALDPKYSKGREHLISTVSAIAGQKKDIFVKSKNNNKKTVIGLKEWIVEENQTLSLVS